MLLSLHKIRRKNNNFIHTTVPFCSQNGKLPVLRESTCMEKNMTTIMIFKSINC